MPFRRRHGDADAMNDDFSSSMHHRRVAYAEARRRAAPQFYISAILMRRAASMPATGIFAPLFQMRLLRAAGEGFSRRPDMATRRLYRRQPSSPGRMPGAARKLVAWRCCHAQ